MEAVAFPRPETFVAADVGGTHVRLALVCESNDAGKPVTVLDYRKYRCAEYPGLAEIMAAFFAEVGCAPVCRGVIASAGYALDDGSVITANLPWVLAPEQIRRQLGMQALYLVNDFEAVAYAANYMSGNQVMQLSGPAQGAAGPALVLGPGTGLGAALWIPSGATRWCCRPRLATRPWHLPAIWKWNCCRNCGARVPTWAPRRCCPARAC